MDKLFEDFIRHAKLEKGLSIETINSYSQSLNLFVKFSDQKQLSVNQLTTEFIRHFFHFGKEERNWSNRTYHIHHCNLKMFCQWLVDNQLLKTNPLLRISKPKVNKPILSALTEPEVHKILYSALFKSSKSHFLRFRNHAMLMLALHSGLRMSEILRLKITDFKTDDMCIHIHEGKGSKSRIVAVTDDLVSVITSFLNEHHSTFLGTCNYLFPSKSGKALTPREFRRITDNVSQIANIKFSSHVLRRTYATRLSQKNVSPFIMQHQLGHSDIKVTMRYVCHQQEEINKTIKRLNLY